MKLLSQKNIFSQLSPAERCSWHLNFLEGWKMWKRFDRCYYFFWSQSRRKTFKRNPDLQVSILSLESELQNGIQSHILYLSFSSRAVRFWLIKCCFVPRAKLTSTYTWFAIFSIGYLQCSDQPYLLISQLDSETPVYGCQSWTQFN